MLINNYSKSVNKLKMLRFALKNLNPIFKFSELQKFGNSFLNIGNAEYLENLFD